MWGSGDEGLHRRHGEYTPVCPSYLADCTCYKRHMKSALHISCMFPKQQASFVVSYLLSWTGIHCVRSLQRAQLCIAHCICSVASQHQLPCTVFPNATDVHNHKALYPLRQTHVATWCYSPALMCINMPCPQRGQLLCSSCSEVTWLC